MAGVCPSAMLMGLVLRSRPNHSTFLTDALNIKYGGQIPQFISVILMPLLIAPTSIPESVPLWMIICMATW